MSKASADAGLYLFVYPLLRHIIPDENEVRKREQENKKFSRRLTSEPKAPWGRVTASL
jgi:hypothetical protein